MHHVSPWLCNWPSQPANLGCCALLCCRPSLAHTTSISGVEISGANSSSNNSSPFAVGMVARSCPKPIVMPRRSRQGSLANHDELSVFVPPHELAASSLLDPTNVRACSCCFDRFCCFLPAYTQGLACATNARCKYTASRLTSAVMHALLACH